MSVFFGIHWSNLEKDLGIPGTPLHLHSKQDREKSVESCPVQVCRFFLSTPGKYSCWKRAAAGHRIVGLGWKSPFGPSSAKATLNPHPQVPQPHELWVRQGPFCVSKREILDLK